MTAAATYYDLLLGDTAETSIDPRWPPLPPQPTTGFVATTRFQWIEFVWPDPPTPPAAPLAPTPEPLFAATRPPPPESARHVRRREFYKKNRNVVARNRESSVSR